MSDFESTVTRLTDLQVSQFVAEAPPSAMKSYGLMVTALREAHAPMTVRDAESNIDDSIRKGLLTFRLPEGFTVTDAGRFFVMTASTGAKARSILVQIEDEK
jgi:hypothetical protein